MTDIDPAALAAERAWDTPTICNALEVVAPHRRATGFTVEHLHCLDPALEPIVSAGAGCSARPFMRGRQSLRWYRAEGSASAD